jgi:hypothetical protein
LNIFLNKAINFDEMIKLTISFMKDG